MPNEENNNKSRQEIFYTTCGQRKCQVCGDAIEQVTHPHSHINPATGESIDSSQHWEEKLRRWIRDNLWSL